MWQIDQFHNSRSAIASIDVFGVRSEHEQHTERVAAPLLAHCSIQLYHSEVVALMSSIFCLRWINGTSPFEAEITLAKDLYLDACVVR